MKFLCDACSRLATVGDFLVREGSLVLVCPECGRESVGGQVREPKHAPVLELAKPRPPPSSALCPKCGAVRTAEDIACAKCGLVFELFRPEEYQLGSELEALWTRLEHDWNDPQAHESFIAACSQSGALNEAARRYRVRAAERPGDALAARFRDQVTRQLLAAANLPPPASRGPAGSSQALKLAFAIVAFLVSVGLLAVAWQMTHAPDPW